MAGEEPFSLSEVESDAVTSDKSISEEECSTDLEILILNLMCTHSLKGISKNFQMACIVEKLSELYNKELVAASIWNFLKKYYDISLIGKNETMNFPLKEAEFVLPETEYELPALPIVEKPSPVPEPVAETKLKDTKRRDSSQRWKKEQPAPEPPQEEKPANKRKRVSAAAAAASDAEKKTTPTAPSKRRRNY